MKRGLLLIAAAAMAAGCSSTPAPIPSSTTQPPGSTAPTSTAPSATTAPSTTTATTTPATQPPPAAPDDWPALIVANSDGVFLAETEFLAQLSSDPAQVAMDDGAGGILFQAPVDGFPLRGVDTVIWYLDANSVVSRDLLVPTGEQFLELLDVTDGVVWYTRSEGDSPESASQTLRAYDLSSGTVDEVATTGGWESGIVEASIGFETIVTYWFAEAASGFDFYNLGGAIVARDGDPYAGGREFCVDGGERVSLDSGELVGSGCFEWPAISGDGLLAYIEVNWDEEFPRWFLVVTELDDGEQLLRVDIERPDQGWLPQHLEVDSGWVLINRIEPSGDVWDFIDPLLVQIDGGGRLELGLEGRASFLTGPMSIP